MKDGGNKLRFLLVQAFSLPETSAYQLRPFRGTKEERLMNYAEVAPLLADVEWDLHPGAPAPHGDWPVELREEFALVGANRLPIVREACESGKYKRRSEVPARGFLGNTPKQTVLPTTRTPFSGAPGDGLG